MFEHLYRILQHSVWTKFFPAVRLHTAKGFRCDSEGTLICMSSEKESSTFKLKLCNVCIFHVILFNLQLVETTLVAWVVCWKVPVKCEGNYWFNGLL